MKKVLLSSLLGLFAFFSVLVLADTAAAQRPGWANRRYNRGNIDRLIRNVEQRTDTFVGQIDKGLDRSRLDGTRREDNLNERAKELERSTDELRSDFDRRGENWWETRDNVQRTLSIASGIDTAMRNRNLGRGSGAEANWRNVRRELNTLARAYNLRPL
jgi:hypothetical protein